jgi:hypothetical protein
MRSKNRLLKHIQSQSSCRSRRARVFGGTLLGACCSMLVLVSAGGAANGGNFILGVNTNSATAVTRLDSTAGTGLLVNDPSSYAIAIQGGASGSGPSTGVYGVSTSSSYSSFGVIGGLIATSPGSTSAAVAGNSYSKTANGPGVWGFHGEVSGSAPGVLGETSSSDANAAGVVGTITSHADYSGGVRGQNFDSACCGFGVVGFHAGQGIGIGGYAPNGFGVFGWSPNNWAAYFDGAVQVVHDLHVNGTLFKGAGAFRIDNPLNPAHSYLQHSFVESPQMMNVYNGNVTTDGTGFATVTLPKWFQALNKDFRYQLTSLSGLQEVAIAREIHDNRFTIQSEKPRSKVSWQVTGVRHDPYANAHRIQVLVPKGSADGKYMHPQLYGQPQSKGETALPGIAQKMPRLKAPASPGSVQAPARHPRRLAQVDLQSGG